MRIELRRNVRMESNREVPQTNRLSLGVLDMDGGGEGGGGVIQETTHCEGEYVSSMFICPKKDSIYMLIRSKTP